MNFLDELSGGLRTPWLMPVLFFAEALVGLLALRNTRRECRVQAVRSPQTVAAVWACFLLHSLLIALAAWFSMWELPIPRAWAPLAGCLVTAAGIAFAVAGFWEFRSLQRMSGLATDQLVTSGVYRISRNPQNVGWGLLLLGIALAGRSGLGVLLAVGYWVVFRQYIVIEERHLAWVFSTKWDRYAARTPRFFSPASLWRAARSGDSPTSPASSHANRTARPFRASAAPKPARYVED